MVIKGLTLKEWSKRILLFVIAVGLGSLFLSWGCNNQYIARHYGGSSTIVLPSGAKLVNVAWKDAHLWHLTRPRRPGESVETWVYSEDSMFGVLSGSVQIKEQE